MRRADRLFRIVEILRRRRVTTAEQLAETLEVSTRTIYRDLADLSGSGVPVEGEAGVGYRLGHGFELPPLMFDEEEVKSVVLGARMVEAWGDTSLRQAARGVLNKVEAMLPEAKQTLLRETALFAPRIRAPAVVVDLMGMIRTAIESRRRIRFDYSDRKDQTTSRTIRPLGLFFWGGTWAVGGWCELRTDHRSFLLDRMTSVETGEPFEPEGDVRLEAFLAAVRKS